MEQTAERRWHEVWREQCEAAGSIRLQYGIASAFDYVVGEKLLTFAEAAEEKPEFAQALAAVRLRAQTHVRARGNRGAPGADRERAP